MIIELRKKSQITLPKEIVKNLNLQEGDKFEVSIENGSIKLEPVAVYPKEYILKLAEEIINKKLSVRETEKLVKNILNPAPKKITKEPFVCPGVRINLNSRLPTVIVSPSEKTSSGEKAKSPFPYSLKLSFQDFKISASSLLQ